MENLLKLITEALDDAYIDIMENYTEYDGTEETLDAYKTDAMNRISRAFRELWGRGEKHD